MAENVADKLKKVVQTIVKTEAAYKALTLPVQPPPLKTPERIPGKKQ